MKKIILFMILLSISTIVLGIGFADVNITLELDGNANVKKIDYIKITNVKYKSDIKANLEESIINNYYMTTINSKIVLGNDITSSISYEVTLRNDTDRPFKYVDTIYDNLPKFYDNENIEYEVTGIEKGELLLPDNEKVITITFKYKTLPIENNVLNSFINIKFSKVFNREYVNIDSNNLITSIAEEESSNIEFPNPPANIEIDGDLDYEYNNGILGISNVTSDIKIIAKEGTPLYSITVKDISIGSTINPSEYENTNENIIGPYMKYTVNSNNQVVKIEGCKTGTANANEVCITAIDSSQYESNKELLTLYFGGNSSNVPSECSEENNFGTMEFTCANSYVVLAVDSDGGIFINDIEHSKSCVINPTFGIYGCK